MNLSDSVDYINAQFGDYMAYSGLAVEDLQGARVFELGFGDNVGVALRFLAAQADYVVCLDKFYSTQDVDQQRRIYSALRKTLDDASKARFDDAIDLTSGIKINPDRINCIYGIDVEDAHDLFMMKPFNLIVSHGAIQHIYEPDAAFEAMDKILAPGGYFLHKIDLSDLGLFRDNGMNPLTFLTIPDYIYRLMGANSGGANRKPISYYRKKMEDLGYDAKLLITDIIGSRGKGDLKPHKERLESGVDYSTATLNLVNQIRPRLLSRFRTLSNEELIVAGLFIVAKKPR